MKSNKQDLTDRGYIEELDNDIPLSTEEKIDLLFSKIPTDRTLGARLLAIEKSERVVKKLIEALRVEKKLYSKIEICNSLISIGDIAVLPLIEELGKIGNNQHKEIPQKEFRKISYPLPRDIAARTLAYMGAIALPKLLLLLDTSDEQKLNEAIDAVGYICFYDHQENVYPLLEKCYQKHSSELTRWTIIRAMSAFPESKSFLEAELKTACNKGILMEIFRSLRLINKR